MDKDVIAYLQTLIWCDKRTGTASAQGEGLMKKAYKQIEESTYPIIPEDVLSLLRGKLACGQMRTQRLSPLLSPEEVVEKLELIERARDWLTKCPMENNKTINEKNLGVKP